MQIRSLITGAILLIIVGISSCRDDFDYELASDELGFSRDTVSLDTIFNHTNSQTYKFTVHNRQNDDVEIPKIYLSRGENSFYKLNVDGMPGYYFENIPIRAKDSIFIFVEIAAGEAPVNPLYEDEINFETTKGTQQVKLLSWIERAKFYIPEQGQTDHNLTETNWTNEYSRVIFGNLNVPQNNALNIQAGTRVYFHNDANLIVNGTLNVTGNLGNEVRFRSDRHDERSDSLPNMWGKIKIKSPNNSIENSINYAIIKGGNIGLEVENSKLKISNTKILNNDSIGLYAKDADITGYNLVINNSDLAALAIEEGGTYTFTHCTFANYHNIGQGIGTNLSLYMDNVNANGSIRFFNSIFYGRATDAILVDNSGNVSYQFSNNVIKGTLPAGINFPNTSNEEPLFIDPGFGKNDLRLKDGSSAINQGDSTYIGDATHDINEVPRNNTNTPNAGAYQVVINE